MDSEEETEVKSFRNTNNNTNHSKDNPATIFEEEENSEPVHTGATRNMETRKLACSFLQKKEDILYEDDEDSDLEKSEEEILDESMERADLEFEFDGVENEENNEKENFDSKLDLAEVVAIFDNFTILHPLKIICDWLSVNDEIVESNLNSPFWSRLVYLCNLLKVQELVDVKQDVSNDAKNILNENQWMQCFSLWEDRFNSRSLFIWVVS